MSRVEENGKTANNFITNLNKVGGQGMTALIFNSPDVARAIIDMAETDVILDISKSLAVIADSMSYIVEDDKRRKEEQNKKTTPDYHHKNGTMKICGFCSKAEFTTMNCDEAIYHCPLHNTDVAFTCTACSDFDDIHHLDWIEGEGWTKRMASESMLPPDKKESEE